MWTISCVSIYKLTYTVNRHNSEWVVYNFPAWWFCSSALTWYSVTSTGCRNTSAKSLHTKSSNSSFARSLHDCRRVHEIYHPTSLMYRALVHMNYFTLYLQLQTSLFTLHWTVSYTATCKVYMLDANLQSSAQSPEMQLLASSSAGVAQRIHIRKSKWILFSTMIYDVLLVHKSCTSSSLVPTCFELSSFNFKKAFQV